MCNNQKFIRKPFEQNVYLLDIKIPYLIDTLKFFTFNVTQKSSILNIVLGVQGDPFKKSSLLLLCVNIVHTISTGSSAFLDFWHGKYMQQRNTNTLFLKFIFMLRKIGSFHWFHSFLVVILK